MEQSIYQAPVHHIKRQFQIQSFERYFLNSKSNFAQLTKRIKNCEIDNVHCRFNIWRLCLGVVSIQSTFQQKNKQIQQSRGKYQQKKDQALKSYNKKSPIKEPVKKNPLMMMGGNKTSQNKQESDQFLKQQIQKDVERTYQEMRFFQDKHIAKLLSLILFVWCRRNPDVSYKQGMNQLLASVVVCYFKEAEFKHSDQKPQQISQQLWNQHILFNSVSHAQSDIYAVFQKIIEIQGDMYKTQADLAIKSKVNPNSKNNTPILQRIMHIKDHKLKHMDLQLFRIIKLQDVQTKSFMLRWIRCMHTREFDLQNSFVIWDSIFLEFVESQNSKKNKQFQFIDAMCLAMFMYMRSIVFTKQTAGQILSVYQKYPTLKRGEYLDELITLAWSICEQLRIQSQNNQASQSNWFQQSQKVHDLHFMQKKPEPKVQILSKNNHQNKKNEAEKQLKLTQNKKDVQKTRKKHSETFHIGTKTKQSTLHSEVIGIDSIEQVFQNHKQKKQASKLQHKVKVTQNKTEPIPQKQTSKQIIKKQAPVQNKIIKTDIIKEIAHNNRLPQKQLFSQPQNNNNAKGGAIKVPQNISISLESTQIDEILKQLNESLPKIRDIDAQSLIRKSIKKIQGKVKKVIQQQQQKEKEKEKQRKIKDKKQDAPSQHKSPQEQKGELLQGELKNNDTKLVEQISIS